MTARILSFGITPELIAGLQRKGNHKMTLDIARVIAERGLAAVPFVAGGAASLPEEMLSAQRWVCWRLIDTKKPPVNEQGVPLADWNTPAEWMTFSEAEERLEYVKHRHPDSEAGVGFALGSGFGGIDLDDCRDPETGVIDRRAQAVLNMADTWKAYAEVSPSGKGFKVFGKADGWLELNFKTNPPTVGRRTKGYFTVTGDVLGGIPAALPSIPLESIATLWTDGGATSSNTERLPEDGSPVPPGSQDTVIFRQLSSFRRQNVSKAAAVAALWAEVEAGRFPPEPGKAPWTRFDIEQKAMQVYTRYPAGEEKTEAAPREPLHAIPAADIVARKTSPAVVPGFASLGSLVTLTSEPNKGKTFLALSVAATVAQGKPWNGRKTRKGAVVYVTFEGDDFSLRVKGLLQQKHDVSSLYIVEAHNPISPTNRYGEELTSIGEAQVTEAIAEVQGKEPVVMVIFDTIRASLSGSEDSSENVSAYLRAVRRIMKAAPEAAGILLHHAGWQDGEVKKKRERGSSAFRGNVDGAFYMDATDPEGGESFLTLKAEKVRDGRRPDPLTFRLRVIDLGEQDENGEPITTCVVEPASAEQVKAMRATALRSKEEDLDTAILQAIIDRPETSSQKSLAKLVGHKADVVGESVDRLFRLGYVADKKQREPFQVTDRGRAWLASLPGADL